MSRLANKICGVKIPFECEWDDETDSRLLDDVLYRTTSGSVQRSNWQVRIDLVKAYSKIVGNIEYSPIQISLFFAEDAYGGICLTRI